ncbi:MAG: hypothetical protein IPL26_15375 [Leptospiraceae bacterium]|nr:hypothetical protein [Leptospiraceae bacterium]
MKNIFTLLIFFLSIQIYSQEKRIISITQTPCQFLEMEGKDLGFQSKDESDCAKINSTLISERKKTFQTLKLKSGEYSFRVTNKGVPYEVGFWLRGTGLGRLLLPGTSGGGLFNGVTKDYTVNLKPGVYKISCPLNSTPDYDIIVE